MSKSLFRGRFAPPTADAVAAIRGALSKGDVHVVVTGADLARSNRVPWTLAERVEMLLRALGADAGRVTVSEAEGRDGETFAHDPALVAAFLHGKEVSVPAAVGEWLEAFRKTDAFTEMAAEARFTEDYIRSWAVAPWPVTLVTVDTVITQADPAGVSHVLFVQRGAIPGRGLYAVPGGFTEAGEFLIDAALREVREETGLALTDSEVMACLKGRHVFDDPERSARGRVITHGFHFELPAGDLPIVTGADDAAEAVWVPLTDIRAYRGRLFEDHWQILRQFLDPAFFMG